MKIRTRFDNHQRTDSPGARLPGRLHGAAVKRRGAASLMTVAVIAVAAGCGGDDGLSEQEFISQADAICQKADRQQAAVDKRQGGIYLNTNDAAFLSRHNAVTRKALDQLRALDAPEKNRKAVKDMLTAIQGSVTAVEDRVAALRIKDLARQTKASQDYDRWYGDINASAGGLGLTYCQTLAN